MAEVPERDALLCGGREELADHHTPLEAPREGRHRLLAEGADEVAERGEQRGVGDELGRDAPLAAPSNAARMRSNACSRRRRR